MIEQLTIDELNALRVPWAWSAGTAGRRVAVKQRWRGSKKRTRAS